MAFEVARSTRLSVTSLPAMARGDEEGAGFDAVGDDLVLRAVQFLHAFDDDAPRAGAFDLRAHRVEEIREIHDFRFGGGAVDDGDAVGEHGGHHDIVGAEHGRAELPRKLIALPLKCPGEDFHVAVLDSDARAESFEALQVQIDRAGRR